MSQNRTEVDHLPNGVLTKDEQNIQGPIMYDRITRPIQTLNPVLTRARKARTGLAGGRHLSHSLAERMAARTIVGPSCWEFQGCKVGPGGYGQIDRGGGQRDFAHRVAWELANGQSVPVGLKVLHSCDNPRCVNPAHLSVGTQAENIRESIRKGRYNTWGIQKLNADQVFEIRARGAAGEAQRTIAAAFGIARNTVSQILNHKTWAHLQAPPAVASNVERVATVNLPVFDFPVSVRPAHVSHLLTRHTSTVMTQIGNRSSVGDR